VEWSTIRILFLLFYYNLGLINLYYLDQDRDLLRVPPRILR
jgi:hypothetical protein